MLHGDIVQAIRKGHFEVNDENGLYLPRQKVAVGGFFGYEHYRQGDLLASEDNCNLVVNEGLNHLLNVVLDNATQTPTWYVGLYKTAVAPAATWTAANLNSNASKADTEFNEATLPEYVEATSTAQSITNTASKATFTFNTTVTINGAFLKSTSVKTAADATGVLFAASQFSVGRDMIANDELLITYTVNATST